MKRFSIVFALVLALSASTALQAMAAYSFGGFNMKDTVITQLNNMYSGNPFKIAQLDYSAGATRRTFTELLDSLNSNAHELFVVGGASSYDTRLFGGGVDVDFNSNTNWGSVQTHYTDVVAADLAMRFYDPEAKIYKTMSFNDLAYPVPHPVPGQTIGHGNNEQRPIYGFLLFEATRDGYLGNLEIKAGDILLTFDQHYNYLNGSSSELALYADMLFVMRGPRAVPVPAAVWLLGSGIAGIAALRRRMQ